MGIFPSTPIQLIKSRNKQILYQWPLLDENQLDWTKQWQSVKPNKDVNRCKIQMDVSASQPASECLIDKIKWHNIKNLRKYWIQIKKNSLRNKAYNL